MSDLDELLRDALHDGRWTLAVPVDALPRVRHAHYVRRRRGLALAAAGCLIASAGTAALVANLRDNTTDQVGSYASSAPQPVAVAGISPAFMPVSGRDWLLTPRQHQDFIDTHSGQALRSGPYPEPATDPSITQARLLAAVQAAGLPYGTRLTNHPEHGSVGIQATLPNGVLVDVSRSRAQTPFIYSFNSSGQPVAPNPGHHVLLDVPRTTSTAALSSNFPYGFPDSAPGAVDQDADGAPDTNNVTVVDAQGLTTSWNAYASVTLPQLKAWAFSSAQTD